MEQGDYMHLGEGIDVRLPIEEGKRFGIVGKSGSGKTNTQLVLARLLIEAGWTVTIIDPMNNFRRLRDAGLPVIVAGARESADVRLTPQNAAALGKLSFDERVSMILDMSFIKNDMDVLQPFLEALWQPILMQPEDGPFVRYAIIVDEADLYIPQGVKTEVSGLILDMGKRGRQLHLSMAIASQRPASMEKNFLTQSHVMVYHKLKGVDIAALKDDMAIPEREIRTMMRRFNKGEALIVADPDMVDMGEGDYVHGQMQAWSGAPTVGSVSKGVQRTGGIDPALLEHIRATAQVVSDRKPVVAQPVERIIERVEVPVISDEQLERLESVARDAISKGEELLTFGREILALMGKSQGAVETAYVPRDISIELPGADDEDHADLDKPDETDNGPVVLAGRPLKILRRLAFIAPLKVTKVQIANLCNYTASGGTFGTYWSALKRYGFVIESGDSVMISDAGLNYLGEKRHAESMSHEVILAMWNSVLGAGERRLLAVLLNCYPHPVGREDLGTMSGYVSTGGTFGTYLGTLRRNDLIVATEKGYLPNAETLRLNEMAEAQ